MTQPLPHAPRRSRARAALAILACLALGSTTAIARQDDPAKPRLEDLTVSEPIIIDALGVTVLVPNRAIANVESVPGGKTTAVITPIARGVRGADWVVQVTNERSENQDLTIDTVLDEFANQRTAQAKALGHSLRIFDRLNEADNLLIAGQTAGRFYCELTAGTGDPLMTGYTVFSTKPGEFIILQLDCLGNAFDTSRVIYETIAASATFEDPMASAEDRVIALKTGAAFLSTITTDDLKAALRDEPQYLRYYRPGPTGKAGDDVEVAFQKIQIRDGQRGELDPDRTRAKWTSAEREYGFLVQIDAKVMQGSTTIDSRSIHFLSRDRTSESWSIRNTIRSGDENWSVIQTMIRDGRAMTIKTIRDGMPDEQRDWTLPDNSYISAVERYMLPRLVAMKTPSDSPANLDLAFFSYDNKNEKLTARRDLFSNIGIDGWRYISQPERTEPEVETILSQQGELIRRTLEGGVIVEPIALERLRRIWKDKGLLIE